MKDITMTKEKVTKMQILAGALLKFGEVDISDLYIIGNDINQTHAYEKLSNRPSNINNYIQSKNGMISLKDNLTLDSIVMPNNITLKALLNQEQGEIMQEYYTNIDEEAYVLRKLAQLSGKEKQLVLNLFCSHHQEIIDGLFNKNMIAINYNEDIIHCDYPEIVLTNLGKTKLFMTDHKEEIDKFTECLHKLNYDQSLIVDYLKTQNLDNPDNDLFTIDSFNYFCSVYDRCPTVLNSSKLNTELPKIKYKKKQES